MTTPTTPATPANKIKIDTFVDPARIMKDVATDASNSDTLRTEHSRQASLVYFYATQSAKAERQYSTLKLRQEAIEAMAGAQVRKDASDAAEKINNDIVNARVRLHPKVVANEQAMIEAKEVWETLKGVMQALRDKSASLIALTHISRDELRAAQQAEQEAQDRDQRQGRGHLANLRSA